MRRCSRHREDTLLDEGPVVSPALTICPSTTARNKAIWRTELSSTRRVRISWKTQKLVQTVLCQRSSLWNHLNCKKQKFIVKLIIVSEPQGTSEQGGKNWSWLEEGVSYQCVAYVASPAVQRADICGRKESPDLFSTYLVTTADQTSPGCR